MLSKLPFLTCVSDAAAADIEGVLNLAINNEWRNGLQRKNILTVVMVFFEEKKNVCLKFAIPRFSPT